MKKQVTKTLVLFFVSVLVNSIDRAFQSEEMIAPFMYADDIKISIAWYAKHICELLSFSILMLCVCSILRPVEKHLNEVKWVGHNAMYVFVKVWHRIFFIVFIVSCLDLVHYIISFRQLHWFFLIQNGFFFIMTSIYLFKAYKK